MTTRAALRLAYQRNRNHVQGVVFILAAAVIWVLASFVVQEVEDEGLSPFLLSYIANSLFIIYLPIDRFARRRAKSSNQWTRLEEGTEAAPEGERLHTAPQDGGPAEQPKLWGWFERDIFKAAAVVAPLWFLAQFTFNTSLSLTSVTSNTILSSTASLFTYGLSWALLQEPFVAHKLVSILVCGAGTAIVTLLDRSNADRPASVAGDALCLVSAGFYACYTVAIKKMLGDDQDTNTVLFFGYVGLINLVMLAPVLLALQLASLVDVAQLTAAMFGLVVAKGLLDNALSDYLWARAVLLIGPTVATVGMSVQLPLAVVIDVAWKRPPYVHDGKTLALMLLGGWYILAGFIGINVPPKPGATELVKLRSGSEERRGQVADVS